MTKAAIQKGTVSKIDSIKKSGPMKKSHKKKKSIHANTFEERQENRRIKEQAALRKQIKKDTKLSSQNKTKDILADVSTWVKDNPIHPSTIERPSQVKRIQDLQSKFIKKTYKAFVRNLPKKVSGEEIDKHFSKSGVNCSYIRILTHRVTNKCLGWGFLEFDNKLDFEKALTLNVSRFKEDRILVEGSLRSFVPSKRRPQKLVTYRPPQNRTLPPMKSQLLSNVGEIEIMEIDN